MAEIIGESLVLTVKDLEKTIEYLKYTNTDELTLNMKEDEQATVTPVKQVKFIKKGEL